MMLNKQINSGLRNMASEPRLVYFLLFLIVLLAAALRFYKLGEWSFWIDEIYTLDRAVNHYTSAEQIIQHIPPNRNWVPVSIILTAQVWNLFGASEWSARLTSAIIGILTLPVLYLSIRKIFGNSAALIAVLLLAVSPWHIFWSQNARFYTTLMLFYTLALLVFHFGIEHNRPRYFVLFYVLFYLAMSERMIAVFLFPVIAAYLFLLWVLPFQKPAGFNIKNLSIFFAPVLLFLVIQIFLLATRGTYMFAFDLEALAAPIDNPARLLIVIAFSIGIPILSLAIFSSIYLLRNKNRAGLFFFISAALPPLMIAAASPFVFMVERYAFVSLAFWIVLSAVGIQTMFSIAGRNGIVFALGIFFILLADAGGENLMYYQINHGNRLDWREEVSYVQQKKQAGDVVISTRAELASYYLGEDVVEYQNLLPEDLEKLDKTVWFIMDYPGIWHGRGESKVWIEDHARLMRHSFLRVREENYMLVYRLDAGQNAIP
jgi:mannosyltransferase